MNSNNTDAAVETTSSVETVSSHLRYAFQITKSRLGQWIPVELGVGKFARVFLGQQQIGISPARTVAIKILHAHAMLRHERLLATEIHHLRRLSGADNVNVLQILDVLQLNPLVLCGCGRIYHPHCPICGIEILTRTELDAYPGLRCSSCSYLLPANRVLDRAQELSSSLARTCCKDSTFEGRGTIINFVHREAIVVEHIPLGLKDYIRHRREVYDSSLNDVNATNALVPASSGNHLKNKFMSLIPKRWQRERPDEILDKALLLEKILLMVQLTEAIDWLHGEKRIVHKDLAADNVMVRHSEQRANQANSKGKLEPGMLLSDLTGHSSARAYLIDFGLADEVIPTRCWYDDEDATGQYKSPFLSPEAKNRRQDIGLDKPITYSCDTKILSIPPEIRSISMPLMPGDTISHWLDEEHLHDIKIEEILDGGKAARYSGEAPVGQGYRRCVLERPLLEPHDVFALGALFYFLLSEDLTLTLANRLHALVDTAQVMGRPIDYDAVRKYDLYPYVRDAIRTRYWRDEVMVVILKAMTRGLPRSYASSRIQRGNEPARRLLLDLLHLYRTLQRHVVRHAL